MPIIRRRPDADLPGLDVGAARRLRELVRDSLTALGVEATVEGDSAATAVGAFSLVPVAEELDGHDRGDWPAVVDEMVTRMVRSLADGAAEITDSSLADHVVIRLLTDAERHGRSFGYARPVVDPATGAAREGMATVLAWIDDSGTEVLNDAALADVDDLDEPFRLGRQRLHEELSTRPPTRTAEDGTILLCGDSWLVSSILLVPELLDDVAADLGDDVLVAVESPDRVRFARTEDADRLTDRLPVSALTGVLSWRPGGSAGNSREDRA